MLTSVNGSPFTHRRSSPTSLCAPKTASERRKRLSLIMAKFILSVVAASLLAFSVSVSWAAPIECHEDHQELIEPTVENKETVLISSSTLCPWKITMDYNENRIPKILRNVRCHQTPGEQCACSKDRRCTQITQKLEVKYLGRDEPEPYTLYTGCVCAKVGAMELVTVKPTIL